MPPAALLTLNVDLGELPDEPDELYALADQVNLACGGHAGDHASLERACRLALAVGARVVAHPSYPDREHFGRRSLTITTDELARSARAQCAALATVAARLGIEVDAVKPHGALYHDAARRPELASALARACREGLGLPPDRALTYVGPPGPAFASSISSPAGSPDAAPSSSLSPPASSPDAAPSSSLSEAPLLYVVEGFADRAYEPDGSLRPRSAPGALLTDPVACAGQALALARSGRFQTLCLHGDTPGAVVIARAVRRALTEAGLLGARP